MGLETIIEGYITAHEREDTPLKRKKARELIQSARTTDDLLGILSAASKTDDEELKKRIKRRLKIATEPRKEGCIPLAIEYFREEDEDIRMGLMHRVVNNTQTFNEAFYVYARAHADMDDIITYMQRKILDLAQSPENLIALYAFEMAIRKPEPWDSFTNKLRTRLMERTWHLPHVQLVYKLARLYDDDMLTLTQERLQALAQTFDELAPVYKNATATNKSINDELPATVRKRANIQDNRDYGFAKNIAERIAELATTTEEQKKAYKLMKESRDQPALSYIKKRILESRHTVEDYLELYESAVSLKDLRFMKALHKPMLKASATTEDKIKIYKKAIRQGDEELATKAMEALTSEPRYFYLAEAYKAAQECEDGIRVEELRSPLIDLAWEYREVWDLYMIATKYKDKELMRRMYLKCRTNHELMALLIANITTTIRKTIRRIPVLGRLI